MGSSKNKAFAASLRLYYSKLRLIRPKSFEAAWKRGVKYKRPACEWMDKFEAGSVKADAPDWVFAGAIASISKNGMTCHLTVDADLVLPSCFKNDSEVRVFGGAAQHFEMSDRFFSFR